MLKIKIVFRVPILCLIIPDIIALNTAPNDIAPTTIPNSFFPIQNLKSSFSTICGLTTDDHANAIPKSRNPIFAVILSGQSEKIS